MTLIDWVTFEENHPAEIKAARAALLEKFDVTGKEILPATKAMITGVAEAIIASAFQFEEDDYNNFSYQCFCKFGDVTGVHKLINEATYIYKEVIEILVAETNHNVEAKYIIRGLNPYGD